LIKYENIYVINIDIITKLENEELVKITSGGTVSIPKQFRKFLEMQKGNYVKIVLEGDHLIVKRVIIS